MMIVLAGANHVAPRAGNCTARDCLDSGRGALVTPTRNFDAHQIISDPLKEHFMAATASAAISYGMCLGLARSTQRDAPI
jgi:hypothetical protein